MIYNIYRIYWYHPRENDNQMSIARTKIACVKSKSIAANIVKLLNQESKQHIQDKFHPIKYWFIEEIE